MTRPLVRPGAASLGDLDGDGRAEVACKTADGTVDGKGQVIGDATADWRVPVTLGDPAVASANTVKAESRRLMLERVATHHNNLGACLLAQCVVQSLRDAGDLLARHLVPELPAFDPAHPGDPGAFQLSASPLRSQVTPRGN